MEVGLVRPKSALRAFAETLSTATPTPADDRPLIMIVDDDENARRVLSCRLAADYRTVLCASAADAENALDSDVAAVILDVLMPQQDGFTAYRALRKKMRHVPILFYSGYQDVKDPYEILNEYRPFAYLSKNGDASVLCSKIREAVAYHRELKRYSAVSSTAEMRILKELVDVLCCDNAAFCSVDGRKLRAESMHAARRVPTATPPPLSITRVAKRGPALFDGRKNLRWPAHDEEIQICPGAHAQVPVMDGAKVLGALSVTWEHATHTLNGDCFARALALAEEVGATEMGTLLRFKSLHNRLTRTQARNRRLNATLQGLQARVNPHFLYNTLDAIAAHVHEDADVAEQMLIELADVFRHVLNYSERELIHASDELAVINAYLSLQTKRLGGRLQISQHVDEHLLSCKIPPLILLPLVENAIDHGVESSPQGEKVFISLTLEANRVCAAVRDTGSGMGNSQHEGTGRSMANLERRLRLHFGSAASITRTRPADGGYKVAISWPVNGVGKCASL